MYRIFHPANPLILKILIQTMPLGKTDTYKDSRMLC